MDGSLVVAIISAVASAATAIFLIRTQRRKLGAEADSVIVSAASQLVHDLQAEVARLRERVDELESREAADRDVISNLGANQHANQAEISLLKSAVDRLKRENQDLRLRVGTLEAENKSLRDENERLRRPV